MDVTKEEFRLIWHLEHGNVRVEMLAHYLKISESEVMHMFQKLEQEGWIEVAMTTDAHGKSEINYALPTEKARPLFEKHSAWAPEE